MEIGLKERLIGAVVLVALGVIIIPLFLKGSPSPDSTVSQPLTLPRSDTTAPQQQYSLPLNASTAPGAALAASTATAPVAAPAATTQPAKPVVHAIPRAATPAPAASSQANGKWVVQVGSYGSQANADKVVATLKQHGIHASVSHFSKAGHTYYRVRVGPFAERADADKAVAAVAKAAGGKPAVVPND